MASYADISYLQMGRLVITNSLRFDIIISKCSLRIACCSMYQAYSITNLELDIGLGSMAGMLMTTALRYWFPRNGENDL